MSMQIPVAADNSFEGHSLTWNRTPPQPPPTPLPPTTWNNPKITKSFVDQLKKKRKKVIKKTDMSTEVARRFTVPPSHSVKKSYKREIKAYKQGQGL